MLRFILISIFLMMGATAYAAPQYQFDFNSLAIAALRGQTDDSPNTIGQWSTSSGVPQVISGSLTAPSATNYVFSPEGTQQRIRITRNDGLFRAQFHQVSPVTGGVIWASALFNVQSQSAAAVALDGSNAPNPSGYTLQGRPGFGIRPNASNGTTEVFWTNNLQNLANNQSVTLPQNFSSTTVLLLARINLAGSSNNVEIWMNPTLSSIDNLPAPTLTATTSINSIDWIGIGAVDTGLSSYLVELDNFLISNDPEEFIAFANVTGLAPVNTPRKISLQYDFNSLSQGALINQFDDSPDDIGSWVGSSFVPQVVSGNLSAPINTGYGFTSGGIVARASLSRTDAAYRAIFHRTFLARDVVWFSALVNAADSSAAAITIDGSDSDLDLAGKAGFGIRPDATGGSTQLFWTDNLANLSGAQSITVPVDYSGETVLLLGRIDFSAESNQVDLWINPSNLSRVDLENLGDLQATTNRTGMEWVGIGAVNDGSDGYTVSFDNLLFSNDDNEDVAFDRVVPLLAPPPQPTFGSADVNSNGIPDYAELLFPSITTVDVSLDSDGDGQSNITEAIAGTDPFQGNSFFGITDFTPDATPATAYTVRFLSVKGKRYQAEASTTLEGSSWTDVGPIVNATGVLSSMTCPASDFPSTERSFIRIRVLPDADTDADGLEDELETYLGYSTTSSTSVRSALKGGDFQQFKNLMMGGNSLGGMAGTDLPGIPSDENASRFLSQASWGATTATIAELKALGVDPYRQWIDQQIAMPTNLTRTYMNYLENRRSSDLSVNSNNLPHFMSSNSNFAFFRENLNTGWMRIMLFGNDQLRQRVAWSLSQIVPIGPRCNSYALAAADWYDTVIRNSFGSYRTLLYEISVHPWMGWWLSHIGNEKATQVSRTSTGSPVFQMPDENYAREIMQLFSIGLWELNMDGTRKLDVNGDPIPTYTNEDITQVARVFTGLKGQSGVFGRAMYSTFPMRMDENAHDDGNDTLAEIYRRTINGVPESLSEAGKKRFLGHELPRFQDAQGRTGLDDVNDTVDIVFNHPSCPPFICKNMIQHLVTSNPTPGYVERVANVFVNDGTGTRGNLAAVVKAILLDPEARNLASALDESGGRLKGPMLRTVHLARATNAGSGTPSLYDDTGIQFWDPSKSAMFADYLEYPYEAPSVFNFYEPGFSRPGEIRDNDLLSPEFQIMNTLTTTTIPNRLLYFIENGMHRDTRNPGITPDFNLQMGSLESLSTQGAEELADHLNLIFSHGFIGAEARAEIVNRINFYPNTSATADERAELALYLSIISAEGSVLK